MLEFLVRCVPDHVRDVVEQTVGSHSSSSSSSMSNYANPHALAASKALHWQQHYGSQSSIYYYPKSHRHSLINGYESRATNHEAFLVRSTFLLFTRQRGGING